MKPSDNNNNNNIYGNLSARLVALEIPDIWMCRWQHCLEKHLRTGEDIKSNNNNKGINLIIIRI